MPTDKHAAAAEVLDSFAEASESIERIPFASPEGLPAPVVEESEESTTEEPEPLRSLADGEDGDGAGGSGSAVSPSAEVWSDETNGAHSADPTAGGDGDYHCEGEEDAGEEAAVAAVEEEEEGEAEAEEEDEASDFVFEPPPASEAQLEQRRGSWNEQSLLLRVSAMSAADVKEWAREASTSEASSTTPPTHSHGIPALRGKACPRDIRWARSSARSRSCAAGGSMPRRDGSTRRSRYGCSRNRRRLPIAPESCLFDFRATFYTSLPVEAVPPR